MNYTEYGDDRPFVTRRTIKTVKKLAPISVAIASFLASHTISLKRDPDTDEPVTVTSEKDHEE